MIGIRQHDDSLAKALGRTHFEYAVYLNRRRGRSGHLWQNRFYSTAMDAGHVFDALAYVDRNPVRAGLIARATDYEWSSARAHAVGRDPAGWLDLECRAEPSDWTARSRRMLEGDAEPTAAELIRQTTRTGRPLGDEAFVESLERRLDRSFRPRMPGPTPRAKGASAGS